MRIAVIGSGIAGLGSALLLTRRGHRVSVFEADARPGGHAHTVDVTIDRLTFPVDTGFLVFNERTYPRLTALFAELGVDTIASSMSFSVRHDRAGIEWSGTNLATLFARPSNALRPGFWRMLADILRFNREATAMANQNRISSVSLAEYLDTERYSDEFRDWYLVPMAAAIWSSPSKDILGFPLPSFVRFCHNHGLLSIGGRPQWRTVRGGSRAYVRKIVHELRDVRLSTPVERVRRCRGHVEIDTPARRAERFDAVVLACHSDQSLALLADPSHAEARLLGGVRYQANRVLLHTDPTLLPRSRRAWSSWNYLAADDPRGERPAAVSYLVNRLQPLPVRRPVIVTLNPPVEPDPRSVLAEFEYAHPLLDALAIDSQRAIARLQGERRTWYAGAWLGNGFHEDGLASAQAIAEAIGDAIGDRTPGDRARVAA
ncbi:MAG: FAD-dependent oxidoreductase [Burkholderiales bacterium]